MKKIHAFYINCGLLLFHANLFSHEIFSLRADIVRRDGTNIDTIVKYTKAGSQRETQFINRIMYGANENLTLELRVPVFLEKKVSEFNPSTKSFLPFKAAGSGKLELVSKFRIYHDYKFAKRNQIILLGGMLFPTVRQVLTGINKQPILGNNTMDFLLGSAGAFETTKFYNFASLLYRINTTAHTILEGNQLSYSYAFGYRPEKPNINKVDWVFLVDFDGIWTKETKIAGAKINDSGGNCIFVGPSFFCSKKNFMLKGGIQFPVIQHLNGIQEKANVRCMIGAFLQF
jgi:hypothetical protein